MNNKKSHIFTWILGGVVMLALAASMLSGCIGSMAGPTPTPTRTPQPVASPIPTLPKPTMTPIGMSAPTVESTTAPTSFPENVNPLTGEIVADANTLDRVPVAIKISNWPGQYVRPQAGINSADIIYEHYNESWFSSRWTAIFLGQDPARVGPVRSGRIIDLELPAIYKAVFACSGFSNGVVALVEDSDLYPDWIVSESLPKTLNPSPFYRDTSRDVPLEHTMYSSPARIRTWATEHGISGRQNLQGMTFSDTPTVEGTFQGKCYELCGTYHSRMLFNVEVVSQAEYDAYVAELEEAGQVSSDGPLLGGADAYTQAGLDEDDDQEGSQE